MLSDLQVSGQEQRVLSQQSACRVVASPCERADDDRITNSNNTTDDAADANIIDVVAKQQQPEAEEGEE